MRASITARWISRVAAVGTVKRVAVMPPAVTNRDWSIESGAAWIPGATMISSSI